MKEAIEISSAKPYMGTEYVAKETEFRLPRALRTLTHLQRYVFRESLRERVFGLDQLTSRSRIGRDR